MLSMFRTMRSKHQKLSRELLGSGRRFQSLQTLGTGGFGDVQADFDRLLRRRVARKNIRTHEPEQDTAKVQTLLQEARLISYLDHPGIVPIYDFHLTSDEGCSYTMKVLEGDNLDARIAQTRQAGERMPLSQALPIFTKICETMAYAHSKGVLHLDLKPANIMLGTFGEVWIVDWGIGLFYDPSRYQEYLGSLGGSDGTPELLDDRQGKGLGSPGYMPYEQMAEERGALAPTADIFAAGVLLYQMLSGVRPFGGDSISSYFVAMSEGAPKPLRSLRGDLPQRLSDTCMKMLQKDPEQRHQSFAQVLQELQEITDAGHRFPTRQYEVGDVLMQEGEYGEVALQILEGRVEISALIDGQPQVLATRSSGDVIGELSVFSGGPRNATVTALEPTVVLLLTREEIERELENFSPWVSKLVMSLTRKVIESTEQVIQATRESRSMPAFPSGD